VEAAAVEVPVERADTDLSLIAYGDVVAGCTKCALAQSRTQVVFGVGSPSADLMFVGEAPGFHEDKQGIPFVGAAGQLLTKLLAGIGIAREDVYIANVLKCLRYNAMVQLGDGSWRRIGQLVRERYTGTVMSVSSEGELVPRAVTGWHATPLAGRNVFRLTFASAKPNGRGGASIELTGDHPVLTDRGFVAAQDLLTGDRVATGQGLSELAWDVVCGTLLGDGSINAASSYLQFGHSARQAEYAAWKASLVRELVPSVMELQVAAVAGGAPVYPVVHVRTRAHRSLRTLRRDFYDERKRVPVWLATGLTARMLAVWFMDDGYMRHRANRRPRAEIATNGFDEQDLQVLIIGLERLGLPAKELRGRLFFDSDASRRLSELIAPFVPEPMRYKLDPDVAASTPFDPSLFESGPTRVMFDDVVVEDVTECPRTDTTFYCIDVDGNHNFVTAGGVVHNCRPPGNRDPLPEEISACEGHLWRQIELIQPALVCTLGNFATKLLSGKPNGITQVHGRPQEVVLGGNAVTLYPIFHPAAALYTPRMLAVLEEDFARIPDLLGLAALPPEPEELPPAPVEQPVQLGLF
jgi:uracil-DNA glycosylase family 4